jgi:hypothetical protein
VLTMGLGYIKFIGIVICGEVLFYVTFLIISRFFNFKTPQERKLREAFKGILERLMLSTGIVHGVITVVIAFSALKIATRLSISASDSDKAHALDYNDYFIVGNSLSILFAVGYAVVARQAGFVSFSMPG